MPYADPKKRAEYRREHYYRNVEHSRELAKNRAQRRRDLKKNEINEKRRANYQLKDPDGRRKAQEWARAHPDRTKEYYKTGIDRLTTETIQAYGGKCVCCNEKEPKFLTIDHINNDGGSDPYQGVNLYRQLRKTGFPKDRYRLMCFNCNCGRAANRGVCPHFANDNDD